jgi:hypothetical protein
MGFADTLLRCTLTGAAGFQLLDVSIDEQPVVKDLVRIATDVKISGKATIEADSPGAMTSALATLLSDTKLPGRDFEIFDFNTSVYKITAANCIDGPHVDVKIGEQSGESILVKPITFNVSARVSSTTGSYGFKLKTFTRPDELRVVTQSGELSVQTLPGQPPASAQQIFFGTILPAFVAAHPYPDWIVTHEYTTDQTALSLTYTITAVEMLNEFVMPTIRDGEGVQRYERDEQMRLVKSTDFDLLVEGNVQDVIDRLRDIVAGGDLTSILREAAELTLYRENRLRLSFSQLEGGDGNALMNWTQKFEFTSWEDAYDVREYPGPEPLLVRKPNSFGILIQSGSATGRAAYPRPPRPLFEDDLVERPKITASFDNYFEQTVTWNYAMAVDPDTFFLGDHVAELSRPETPVFY